MKIQAIGLMGCLLFTVGCAKRHQDNSKVIANVGGEKITENAFESLIRAMGNEEDKIKEMMTKEDMKEKRNGFLSQFAKGKAIVKLAKAQALDKDPSVQMILEQAAANTYLETLLKRRMPKGNPTDAELKVLYDKQVAQFKLMAQGKNAPPIPPFEQVKAQLVPLWKNQQMGAIVEQIMAEATQKFPVTYADGYKPKEEKEVKENSDNKENKEHKEDKAHK